MMPSGALDAHIVDEIEELHQRVARTRAEERFGFTVFGVAKQLTDVEAAEQALLTEHGFVSYDDFRHRVGLESRRESPPTDPPSSGGPDQPCATPSTTDYGEASSSVFAAVRARADELIAELNEEVQRQLARIEHRTADGLAEILRRTIEGRDAVSAFFDSSAACPGDLPTPGQTLRVDGDRRRDKAALKRELGELTRGDTAAGV
jgi:hypothetical protein